MPNTSNTLPEGTGSVVTGDNDFTPAVPLTTADAPADPAETDFRAKASAAAQTLRDKAGERTADLRGQAGDRAREFAEQGKDRATAALENVARLIGEAAGQVDEKVGADYGDYARRAADAVDGLAATLRDKDVDDLFEEARALVKRSPAMAVGAAAVLGFALVRVIKAGAADAAPTPADSQPERTSKAPKTPKKGQKG